MKDDVPKYIFVKDVLGEQNIAHVYVKKNVKYIKTNILTLEVMKTSTNLSHAFLMMLD